ncbi:MAG: DNA polymerase III subunit delta [Bacteroidota bacterium]
MARARATSSDAFRIPSPGELAPVYLLHGEEDLLREEALKAIVDVAVPAEHRSFNLDVVQASDTDIRDILGKASAFPLMADRRAVVIRDVEKFGKDDLELLTSYVENPLESSVLILTSPKVDLRKKPFAGIHGAGHAFEFTAPKESELPRWIAKRVSSKGCGIDDEAARLLASFAGKSLRDLDQELEKIILYCGDRKVITPDDVSAVAGVSKEYNIWELQHAIAVGDRPRALTILTRMVEDGNGAPYFVVMLTSFFTMMRRLHDMRRRGLTNQDIAAELQRNPWTLRDQFEALGRYSAFDTERALGLLLAVDDQTKSGGDDLTLLQTLIVEVLDPIAAPL